MAHDVEITSFDLRYEGYRIRHEGAEKALLASILDNGVRDPLQGVDAKQTRILLDGFKRYHCAKKLGISIVPYSTLGGDEALGIIQFIRLSNSKNLSILEQARLIDDLKNTHQMSVSEIAEKLERSKSWVSVRLGVIAQMSDVIREKIFCGEFPAYSFLYTLRRFIRINNIKKGEVEEFVNSVAGKKLSIRDIEHLAHGYFNGTEEFREQIKSGNISWGIERLKEPPCPPDDCNEYERGMLKDLEITEKYMRRVTFKSKDSRFKNSSFYAQANLFAGEILKQIELFSKSIKDFYDRSGQT